MKPRNDDDREVLNLSALLSPISKELLEWMKEDTAKNGDTYSGGSYTRKDGTKKYYTNKNHRDRLYTIPTTIEGWQVFRFIYYNYRYVPKGWNGLPKGTTYVWWFETMQIWIHPDDIQNPITLAMPRKCMPNSNYQRIPWSCGAYSDFFMNNTDHYSLQVRGYQGRWFTFFTPQMQFLPAFDWWRKVMEKEYMISVYDMTQSYGTYFETLLKMGRTDIYKGFEHSYFLKESDVIASIKIALRHNGLKEGDDTTMWFDHLRTLSELGYDIRSPKYLCPADLLEEHNRMNLLLERKRERERREREERRRIEEAERRKALSGKIAKRSKVWGKFTIVENGLTFVPLITIRDYKTEGKKMHHCVGGYYANFDSLILSARDDNGKIWETIEVNLRNFGIIQSRGVCNQPTERHDEIRDIVTDHMEEIRRIQSKAKKKAVVASA